MAYHQDWLMRQIEAISATLAYLLTGKKSHLVTVEAEHSQFPGTNTLYLKLQALVKQGDLCSAENLLYDAMEEDDPEVPEAAVRFYGDINQLSDAQLVQCNFSREEIMDGLKNICQHYHLDIV